MYPNAFNPAAVPVNPYYLYMQNEMLMQQAALY
jgi:hypothetical protein